MIGGSKMREHRKISEIIDDIYDYAAKEERNLFSVDEIVDVVGRAGMRGLINCGFLEEESQGMYRLEERE